MIAHRRFTTPSKHKQTFPGILNIVTVKKKSNWSLTVRSKLELCQLLWNIWWWILCVRTDLVYNYRYLTALLQEHANKKSFVAPSLSHSALSLQQQTFLISSSRSMS
jgi:hypothetical protein